ncbi:MAG TPA: 3-isopropylmalate dehydratase small subunit [Gemmatimonadaceae bacterium]|jgi:3-isopropylmalate/(R)-2-methylmalate dehydratase small subunit|nr:3-isopropylmalate dehydratase small subunit [Gemmatimonadaceae bacterium]
MYPFTSPYITLPIENIDTDQIIPARFLKTTDKIGLGAAAFHDWRYTTNGAPKPDFILNRPEAQGAQILVAGHNFGCGSSREHAPWALIGTGLRAIVSSAFADIFQNNALKNGLLPIQVDSATLHRLLTTPTNNSITVDLDQQTITTPDGISATFPIDPFAKHCLLHGVDQLGFLLALDPIITTFEQTHTLTPAIA